MTDAPVCVTRQGAVAEITLNRPKSLNALNRQCIDMLTETVRDLSAEDCVRAIVLTGAGRAFSCGVDLKELSATQTVADSLKWHGGESLFDVMRACPHPIICAVNGFAITGGLELALMGDFLIASDTAQFADTHARVGITPSWGMTQILPRLIGINRARQMSLTGEFVTAQTAYDWGLVNEVVPGDTLMPRARDLAGQISETDRSTMTRIRDLIALSAEFPLTESLGREVEMFVRHIRQVSPEAVAEGRAKVTERGRKMARPDRGRTKGEDT
ncbi:enoyl-CoA hydratase [Arenibacterium sp. CAU 1754]